MASTEAYKLAKWFVEEVRGLRWYYPKHAREANVAKQLLHSGKDPAGCPITSFTADQVKTVVMALTEGCHLTDYEPIETSKLDWMADKRGIKGLWAVRNVISEFFDDPPEPPPYWDQPKYDKWVRTFGLSQFKKGRFLVYQGWNQWGPDESGISIDELTELFGEEFADVSLAVWRKEYDKSGERE